MFAAKNVLEVNKTDDREMPVCSIGLCVTFCTHLWYSFSLSIHWLGCLATRKLPSLIPNMQQKIIST